VNNVDGQVSFINEIERRIEIETLRQHAPADWMFAVETVYADHGSGIILSPWVDGRPLEFNATELGDLFDALVEFAANGFFEWDLCRGNYLWTNSGIRLFDYGYTYRFDPLSELNSNGGAPTVFNIIERFESRCFFGHLLHLLEHSGLEAVLAVYFLEKGLAMRAFEQLRSRLAARGATHGVLSYYNEIIRRTRSALKDPNDLRTLFRLEAFRSWRLDVEDDLSGKICNAATLSKARILARIAAEDYRFLNDHDGLFFGEELMSEHDLVAKYDERLRNVQALLEASTLPRPGAKVGRHEP
jgi:hypothetical protein